MSANYVNIAGGTTYTLNVIPSNQAWQNNQFRLICKTAGGAITINLPPISAFGTGIDAKIFVEDADDMSATNNITINVNPANTINDTTNFVIDEDGKKIEIYISSTTEYGILGGGGALGGGGSTLFGLADGRYPINGNITQDVTAEGITDINTVLKFVQPYNNLKTISFPDALRLDGGLDFQDDLTGLLESLSFPVLQEAYIEAFTIQDFQFLTNISAPQLKKIIIADVVEVSINNNAVLPTLSFPLLTDIECTDTVLGSIEIEVFNNPMLASVNFSNLENIDKALASVILFQNLPACASIDLSKLTKGNNTGNGVSEISYVNIGLLPLVLLPEALTGISIGVRTCPLVESVAAPKLLTSAIINVADCASLTLVSFPLLTSVISTLSSEIDINTNPLLTSVLLPSLSVCSIMNISDNVLLTSIAVSASLDCISVQCVNNALGVTSVDNMLAALDASGVINGVVDLSGGTNATPTGGALNVNTVSLQGKGWTVTTN